MTDPEWVASFDDGTLPADSFRHADHVRMAFLYLSRHPALEAIGRFSAALRRLASVQGKPGLYHETVTWAFLLLIAERRARAGGSPSWDEFAARNPDLLEGKGPVLKRYYRDETLASELARRTFLLPDRSPEP